MTTNIQAEAFADQVRAAIRNDEPIPDGPIIAAAARVIRRDELPEEIRDSACRILDSWAKQEGVERPID